MKDKYLRKRHRRCFRYLFIVQSARLAQGVPQRFVQTAILTAGHRRCEGFPETTSPYSGFEEFLARKRHRLTWVHDSLGVMTETLVIVHSPT
jgi:hypothetical protein